METWLKIVGTLLWGAGYLWGLLQVRRVLTIHRDPTWGEIFARVARAWVGPALLTLAGGLALIVVDVQSAWFILIAVLSWGALDEFYDEPEPSRWTMAIRRFLWVFLVGVGVGSIAMMWSL